MTRGTTLTGLKDMKNIVNNFVMVLGNLVLFGAIYYAVFFLHQSGWWFAFLVVFHFSFTKDEQVEEPVRAEKTDI